MNYRYRRDSVTGILFLSGLFLIAVQNSLLPSSLRRLGSDSNDSIDQLSELYRVIFDEDVSEDFAEIQKQVRIRSECESYPDLDTPPEGFIGTDHIDSHLTTISCVPVHYRIPTSSVQGVENSMVFGILSTQDGKVRRDSIRKTWGKEKTIFFIISGDWEKVQEEYYENLDILWVDQAEEYSVGISKTSPRKGALTFKSEAFLVAMYDQVQKINTNVKYFFKTDDDCFINNKNLEEQIAVESKGKELDYWGQCEKDRKPYRYPKTRWYLSYIDYPYTYYPHYCAGAGYLLSPNLLECAVGEGHVEKVPYIRNEDAAVGLLAERCGMEPSIKWLDIELDMSKEHKDLKKEVAIQHNVSPEDMVEFHQYTLSFPDEETNQHNVEDVDPAEQQNAEDVDPAEQQNAGDVDPAEQQNVEDVDPAKQQNVEDVDLAKQQNAEKADPEKQESKEQSAVSFLVSLIKKIS